MDKAYFEQMRAHLDEGGKLNHQNAVDLLGHIEDQIKLDEAEKQTERDLLYSKAKEACRRPSSKPPSEAATDAIEQSLAADEYFDDDYY